MPNRLGDSVPQALSLAAEINHVANGREVIYEKGPHGLGEMFGHVGPLLIPQKWI